MNRSQLWTEQRDAELRRHWEARVGRRDISVRMGLTVGQVLGRSKVLNLKFTQARTGQITGLAPDHNAVLGRRTIYPASVRPARDAPALLVSGYDQRKIGRRVTKGAWRGMPIFTLTLEERATCPDDCFHYLTCYGNAMPFAKRNRHGRDLEQRLAIELSALQHKFPDGFVVRLHILGDFYDLAYVSLWRRWLGQFPAMRVWGYTARQFPGPGALEIVDPVERESRIMAALIHQTWLDHPDRWLIRFSSARPDQSRPGVAWATTIFREPEGAVVPEGIVCPVERGTASSCAACGLCWAGPALDKVIVFVAHGKGVRGPAAQEGT